MKKLGKWFSHIGLVLVLLFFGLALALPVFFSGKLAIVRSSSMEPVMPAGAMALMMPVDPEEIKEGDIITFEPSWDPDVTVSHRVVEVRTEDGLYFATKGDATEDVDPYLIPPADVHGKVVFSIPYLGFVMSHALDYVRTWWGFAFLIVVPSVVLVGSTVRDIIHSRSVRVKRLMKQQRRQQRWKR